MQNKVFEELKTADFSIALQFVWFDLTANGTLAAISLIIYSLWKKERRDEISSTVV